MWLKAVAAGDVLTELIIILLPIIGFYDTLMPVKRRVTVILAFSTRIPYVQEPPPWDMRKQTLTPQSSRNIIISVIYLISYSRFINNRQPAISVVPTVAWQNALLSFNLMSATIPSLKGFTQGFMTAGVSLGYAREGTTSGGMSGTHQSYELRSLAKSQTRPKVPPGDFVKSQASATSIRGNMKRDSIKPTVAAKDGPRCYHEESASIASHDSRQIMIKREWEISED
jgi:hypothetical protein